MSELIASSTTDDIAVGNDSDRLYSMVPAVLDDHDRADVISGHVFHGARQSGTAPAHADIP
jgi:hypothetical protein